MRCHRSLLPGCALLIAVLGWTATAPAQGQAQAPAAEPARAPLRFLSASVVKPNLYFILDDSSSMQWSYLGDEVVTYGYENAVGYRSSDCNKIYYNPALSYPVPVDSAGQPYPAQEFGAALYDGFQPASIRIDLASGFMPWRSFNSRPPVPASTETVRYLPDCWSVAGHCSPGSGLPNVPGPAHYYVYQGDQAGTLGDNSASDHCKDLSAAAGTSASGATHWRQVIVSASSGLNGADERQNFANWFSYHRTRVLTMKTAVGRAFAQLDARLRVGYSTTSETSVDGGRNGFLPVRDFDARQRGSLYDKLYAVVPVSGTPLRGALAKAGQLYAGKLLRDGEDPVQYACQQNHTLLSTDGYWNTDGETVAYGPLQVDGLSAVGDRDHQLPRPMFDGLAASAQVRVATLVVGAVHAAPTAGFSGVRGITVDGKDIMLRGAGLQHTRLDNAMADAIQLARLLAAAINRNGYRAFAELNVVTVIAPASAGAISSRPVVDALGSLPISAGSFGPPTGTAPRTNTLADIAAYYANTDLRQPAFGNCGSHGALCENNVPSLPGGPAASHQHMVTHTLGLGANGTLRYRDDYDTASDGDYRALLEGRLDWPDPIFFPGGERIDDLWHAAVNGRGRYFSARSPEALARALAAAMTAIRTRAGAASAVATSSQQPVPGDDLLYASRYRSVFWDGDLEARRISISEGQLTLETVWSASALLDAMASESSDTRTIWMASSTAALGLKEFRWSAMEPAEQALFNGLCPGRAGRQFAQCANLPLAQRVQANGRQLVDYLRGQRGHEERADRPVRLFRAREHLLGAAVNASPLHVGQPPFRYADDHYGEFRDVLAKDRRRMVYLAANDGMLHAFDASTGHERWAFLPSSVLPALWRSADTAWANEFSYLHDGTPVAGDICPTAPAAACAAGQWRTVLIGSLGAGGRAYYALDITQPDSPALLWQFDVGREPELGLAMARPVITKRRDGRWVALIASGYANVNPGNGRGMLFVLDAATGALLSRIDTGAGSSTQPAGLAQLNAWIDSTLDNTAGPVYGGDLLGNVWRIDINGTAATTAGAAGTAGTAGTPGVLLLAQLDHAGQAQPVTTRPELSLQRIGNRQIPVVTVATGRLLGLADVADKSVQSVYTFRDDLGAHGLGRLQGSTRMVQQQLSASGADERAVSAHPVDWTQHEGWYLNLDVAAGSGERVTIDPEQQLGILRVIGNVPDGAPCQPRAQAWVYQFNVFSGSHLPVDGATIIARRLGQQQGMVTGASTVWIDGRTTALLTDESGIVTALPGAQSAAGSGAVRRVSWRELE